MEKHEDSGIFELFIPEMKAGTAYKYEIKFKGGNIAVKTDPYCRQCDAGQGFASVVYADIDVYKRQLLLHMKSALILILNLQIQSAKRHRTCAI